MHNCLVIFPGDLWNSSNLQVKVWDIFCLSYWYWFNCYVCYRSLTNINISTYLNYLQFIWRWNCRFPKISLKFPKPRLNKFELNLPILLSRLLFGKEKRIIKKDKQSSFHPFKLNQQLYSTQAQSTSAATIRCVTSHNWRHEESVLGGQWPSVIISN